MDGSGWLTDTRASYDTVADAYADQTRDGLARLPLMRSVFAMFADRVRAAGAGPVVDVGCGPGQVTAHLSGLGLDVSGIDLSPGMVEVARRDHPGLRFEVGSMTDLPVGDGCATGVLAWFSLIHVPDAEMPAVLAHFHRALRNGGLVLLGFHAGDSRHLKTQGYGGHPMRVSVYRRPAGRVAGWLSDAGFAVEARMDLDPDSDAPWAAVMARRPC